MKTNNNIKCLVLYANCLPVKGSYRTILCDILKQRFYYIPLSLYLLIEEFENSPFSVVQQRYRNEDLTILESYVDFLINNDLAFWVDFDKRHHFSKLNMKSESSAHVTNGIFDYSDISAAFLEKYISELQELGCLFVQIRVFFEMQMDDYFRIKNIIHNSKNIYFELVIGNSSNISIKFWEEFLFSIPNVTKIEAYGIGTDCIHISDNYTGKSLFVSKKLIASPLHCGVVSMSDFSLHQDHFFEAQNFNTCLNKKISVDKDGLIKNCPSMNKDFGSIENTSLSEVLSRPEFSRVWKISKDKVATCKECEFRYVCTDCRAYLLNPSDLFSKPLKCGYNPKTGVWDEWASNPLAKNAIENYGLNELVHEV